MLYSACAYRLRSLFWLKVVALSDCTDHRILIAEMGMAAAVPAAPAPKRTVPTWLRAEMLKRGINLNASGGDLPIHWK